MEQVLKKEEQLKSIIKIDELGRIHIPIQARNMLNIQERDRLYIYRSGVNIILKKANIKDEKKITYCENKIIDNDTEVYIQISKIKNSVLENSNGKLRTVDELGNCVIPIEIRKELRIHENNTFKICIKDNKIILIKNK